MRREVEVNADFEIGQDVMMKVCSDDEAWLFRLGDVWRGHSKVEEFATENRQQTGPSPKLQNPHASVSRGARSREESESRGIEGHFPAKKDSTAPSLHTDRDVVLHGRVVQEDWDRGASSAASGHTRRGWEMRRRRRY
jgi:hypothetical protein